MNDVKQESSFNHRVPNDITSYNIISVKCKLIKF